MPQNEKKLDSLLKKLETERDELRLKIGLAKLEAREELQEMEKKLDHLRGRMRVVGEEAKDASGEVRAAAETLANEIREGFARIRKMM